MKKLIQLIFIFLLIAAGFGIWFLFGPNTTFEETSKYLFIRTGQADRASVLKTIKEERFIKNPVVFDLLAKYWNVWERIRPGRYEVTSGMSLFKIARMLRNRQQQPVNLIINKFRTKGQLASFIAQRLECDSVSLIQFMESPDSVNTFGLDTANIMTIVIPNTYNLYWNTSAGSLMNRLYAEHNLFWNESRKAQADTLGLSPEEIYIMASIVEEETNRKEDKPKIARVYFNRIRKGLPLQADPTIKFAMKDFGLQRVLNIHLQFNSPYNTYLNKGLPPGPICIPSIETIEACLNPAPANYLYFVAKPDFSGYSNFSETYSEHQVYAKQYQQAIDSLFKARK